MKKQYINPETNIIVLIAQSQLMTGSDPNRQQLKTEEVSNDTQGFVQYSRVNSLWDDDEE